MSRGLYVLHEMFIHYCENWKVKNTSFVPHVGADVSIVEIMKHFIKEHRDLTFCSLNSYKEMSN